MLSQKIEELAAELRDASTSYYLGSSDKMSDAEFDKKKRELEKLCPDHPFLKEVGASVKNSPLSKVKHSIPMGSLNNIFDTESFESWIKNTKHDVKDIGIVVQWKLDGLSIELVYKNGTFVQAITRGDGEEGEDVTHTICKAQGFPHKIKGFNGDLSVRAEAVLPLRLWKKNHSDTANPRNAASGLVRRKSAEKAEDLLIVPFDVEFLNNEIVWTQEFDKITWLKKNGFSVVDSDVMAVDRVMDFLNNIMEPKRDSLDFLVDGAVLKINNLEIQKKLGEHDGRPKWAKAYKFAAAGENTIIEDVVWQVGSSGNITPVACVKPVFVGGTTISRVTLHNCDEVERLDVAIGDTVEIIRSADVIPKILRVVIKGKKRKKIEINECPECGAKPIRVGPFLRCSNSECEGRKFSRIQAWIKKRNIMHLGDESLSKMVEGGLLTSVSDLYLLKAQDLIGVGIGEKMSEKILGEIEKSRDCTLFNMIGSLSIDMLGRSEAENICDLLGFTSAEDFLSLDESNLIGNKGYGKVKAERIVSAIKKNKKLIKEVAKHMKIKKDEKVVKETGKKLASLSFCFTGAASIPRKDLQAMVEDNGGTNLSSVRKGLNYLVIADPESQSVKAQKARELGVKLISEKEFFEMCGN